MRRFRYLCALLLLVLPTSTAWAHVGNKDVFEQVLAGPYKLFITIRPPNVIPGVATVEVRTSGDASATAIHITPMPLTGEASKHPPSSDAMVRSEEDPTFFTGGVWMMATGSWQVRFQVDGSGGPQTTSVPVPAIAISTLKMDVALGWTLAALGLVLVLTMAGLVAAAVSESRLRPGVVATPALRRRGLVAMGASLALMALAIWGGATWWNVEAASYSEGIYKPLSSEALLKGNTLDLLVAPQERTPHRRGRTNSDFLPDHGHLIHLYAIRKPGMDAVFHLHPELVSAGDFRMQLPAMPPGSYSLYGDVVHASGFPETLVAQLEIPATMVGGSLGADDAEARPSPVSSGPLGTQYKLPDGYTMIWDKPDTLIAHAAYSFHFRLVGPDSKPATVMQPYLGMAGHAAFVKTDGTVFAHTHPEGSAAMAALEIANGPDPMAMATAIQPEVSFPYGFPSGGNYRIFIQMKHAGTVETGIFDAAVKE